MAERVRRMPIPEKRPKKEMDREDFERIARRRQAVDLLRKQATIANHRLRMDIFNTWRTGGGTQAQIAEAANFSEIWVNKIIDDIKDEPTLLEEAIREWIKENPNKSLNGRLDNE
jgi:hypothetical protein